MNKLLRNLSVISWALKTHFLNHSIVFVIAADSCEKTKTKHLPMHVSLYSPYPVWGSHLQAHMLLAWSICEKYVTKVY